MAPLDRFPGVEVHAERSTEESLFDVVNSQGVAGQQEVDVTGPDELLKIRRPAGVHHMRDRERYRREVL